MPSVQCYGVPSIVKAAENQHIAAWAIFEGKHLRFKYDGDDLAESMSSLEQFCKFLQQSTALYTLRFYEEPAGKINNNTPYNASVNFRMTEDEDEYWRKRNSFSDSRELQLRVQALEQELAAAREEDEEEPETIGGALMGLLNDPQKLYPLLDVFNSLRAAFGYSTPAAASSVAGAHRMGATATNEDDAMKRGQRVANALDSLESADPQIVEHLEKLAKLSQVNKPLFEMVIKQLDNLQV